MSLVIDIAILVLLVGVLAYAWIVERRVRVLMQALRELEPMIGSFSAAVDRSEGAVSMLKTITRNVSAPFGDRVSRQAPPPQQPEARREREREQHDDSPYQPARERSAQQRPAGAVPMKSELVRGFFETVRSREA
ncbi:hypothetical protein ATO6_20425 [Oceanicola sp. 22II-s10i]|uniref:flagellar motor switch protein n=1 Tax=Oceanicola sp. 22II-s10i TaxID=1317116 RepID=UPI000B522077|nr:flagellar motor switch protein [Oceanicola sp. 22II-s10i]OWU83205.1 hypothetical protein ATO6_20425 [Oceanicola sp. 22II-s10i]